LNILLEMRLSPESREVLLRLSLDDLKVLSRDFQVDLTDAIQMICPYHGCQVYVNRKNPIINVFGISAECDNYSSPTKWLYQIGFNQWMRFFKDVFELNGGFKYFSKLQVGLGLSMLEFLSRTHVCLCNILIFKEVIQVMDWSKVTQELYDNPYTTSRDPYFHSIYTYVRQSGRTSNMKESIVEMICTTSFGFFFKLMVTSPTVHDVKGKNDLWFMLKNKKCYYMETNVLDFKPMITAFEVKCNRNNIQIDIFLSLHSRISNRVRKCHGDIGTFSKQSLRIWNRANFKHYRPGIRKCIFALYSLMKYRSLKTSAIRDMIVQEYLTGLYYEKGQHQIKDYFYHDSCDDCRGRSVIMDKCARSALNRLLERARKAE